ncbi:MAG: hypothetical protein ABI867_05015 [Kofleriaceae bacterium]
MSFPETMQCPRCGKPLVRYDDRDKWRCKACNGALVGAEQLVVEIGDLAAAVTDGEADPARPAIHPCPICAFPMTPYTIAATPPIELDRCVEHRVVWFDGGEIGKTRGNIPPPAELDALAKPLEFLATLQSEIAAEAEPVVIPPAEPVVVAPGEWENRTVCPDGACTGVIGADGACSVCGTRAAV